MRKKLSSSGIVAGVLVPMGIICLFALGSLALALFGGQVYQNIQAFGEYDFETTVMAYYLRTKLLQNNTPGAVHLETQDGIEMLAIDAEGGDGIYQTRIFVYDGQLMEIFAAKDKALDMEDATVVAKVRECRFSISENNLFMAEIIADNGDYTRVAFALVQGGIS